MTRCLFVTTALPPERGGGAEAYCVQLAAHLGDLGMTIDVLGRNGGSSITEVEQVARGRWIRLGVRVHPYFGYLVALHTWLREHADDYDLIQFFDMNTPSAVGINATKGMHMPRVVRDEQILSWSDPQLDQTRVPFLGNWSRTQLRLGDQYVVVSRSESAALAQWGIAPDRISYIPNGIETARFPRAPMEPLPIVVCPARLRQEKNHMGLVRVFGRVVQAIPNARLLLPGDGPMADAVAQAITTAGLTENVEFLGHVDDMASLYRRCRAVCLLSEAEGPSLGILEAASCGRPAVVTNVGGLVDSVIDGVTGMRVGFGDDDEAVRALTGLLSDDSMCERMGEAASLFVAEERSLSAVSQQYAHYLESVIANGTRCTPEPNRESVK